MAEQSVGELVKQATEQMSDLVRQELRLATAELTEKGKKAGVGGGLFASAGAIAYVGLMALAATVIAALALVMDVWLAALIVTVLLFAVAGVLAVTGRKQIQQATPAKPEAAIAGVKADVDEIKERAHR
ncbi:phage holin family protein [Streptomyces sp. NPDC060194]|uniref:phage holin family protein n=1 Tax=Streptomyces sp. NPDC060194 TaxID=3347069 RepID=UPI003668B33C